MIYRYVFGNSTNPYYNLAIEQILFNVVDKESVILYLWQNENTIVVGRNQDVYVECRVEEFVATGGKIARRNSGGGTVYHDLGNLNYSIISSNRLKNSCQYQDVIMKAIQSLGVCINFNGRNDLIIKERKFSGNAIYTNGRTTCQHGTLLVNSDLEKMNYFLTPNKEKLCRNRVSSVASRVMNLSEVLPKLTVETLKDVLISVVEAVPLVFQFNMEEVKHISELYASNSWIFRRNFE